jgi:CHAT domain-containing protein
LASAQLAHYRGLHEANRGRTDSAARLLAEAEARFTGALPPDLRSGPRPGIAMGGLVADPVAARALVGLLEAQRNRAAVLRSAGRTRDAEIATSQANALSAAAPGMVGADLIAARLARTGGAVMASSGAAGAADASFGRSAQRFARGIPRSRPYADTLLLRVASLSASSAAPSRLLPLCREATQVLRTLREGTSGERVASCVDAFIAASNGTEQPLLAEAFETAQLAQGDVTTTQIARAAARLTEGSRDPAVSDAIRKREDAARELSRLFRERDLAGGTGGAASATALAELDAQIEAAQTAAGEAEEAVQAAAPGYAQLVQSVSSAAEVLAALGRGEALATMFIPPSGLGWTFLLADGRITAGRIALELAGIAALVAELRVTVEEGDDSRPFAAEAAWKLHQAVFAQVSAPLGAARRLVVSPAGPLLQLPFGMLVEAPPPAPAGHDGVRFMLARLPVAHVPAPSSLVALRRIGPSRAARPWIGFGDPRPVPPVQAARSFPADPSCGRLLADLPALRATRAQMLVSQELMGARPSEVRMGEAFTLAAVRAASLRDYRVVHFATHGVLPQDLSCLSEPALIASVPAGAGSAEAALLTSDTVLGLDLDADAVVLSACNSGGGTAAGESLSSLARSFFYAGARSLVVTHWYVNEVTAARTVAVMLQNLRDGADSAEALRAAQLRLIRDVPRAAHPAYWAPFAVIGTTPGRATTTVQLGTEGRS